MQGLFSGVWGLSSVIGPLVGGFITDQLSWRWVFFINVPFGIIGAVIIGFALVEPRRRDRPKIDYLGAVVLTVAVSLLMLVLVESGTPTALLRPMNVVLLAVFVALMIWFVRIERRAPEPVIPLDLFRNRIVTIALIVGFLAGVAMFGAISFLPLYAQGTRGVSATAAGSFLTPLLLSWVAASIVGGRLLIRLGSRPLVLAGLVSMIVGFGGLTAATRQTPIVWLIVDLVVVGAGLGLTMLTLLIAVQHAVPRSQLGIATSLNQFFRSIGGAIGVALLGAVLYSGLAANLTRAASQSNAALSRQEAVRLAENPSALVMPEARAAISPRVLATLQDAMAKSIRSVFATSAAVCIVGLAAAFFLPPGRIAPSPPAEGTRMNEDGETFVMAEMAVIDAENEPECRDLQRPSH